jgi:hypothetical protein
MSGGVDATRDRLAQRAGLVGATGVHDAAGDVEAGALGEDLFGGAVGEAHLAGAAAAVEPPACMISPSTRSAPNPDRLRAVLARR